MRLMRSRHVWFLLFVGFLVTFVSAEEHILHVSETFPEHSGDVPDEAEKAALTADLHAFFPKVRKLESTSQPTQLRDWQQSNAQKPGLARALLASRRRAEESKSSFGRRRAEKSKRRRRRRMRRRRRRRRSKKSASKPELSNAPTSTPTNAPSTPTLACPGKSDLDSMGTTSQKKSPHPKKKALISELNSWGVATVYRLEHLPPANLLHICTELKASIANKAWVAHTERGTNRPGLKCMSPCVTSSRKTTPLGDEIPGSWCYTAGEEAPFSPNKGGIKTKTGGQGDGLHLDCGADLVKITASYVTCGGADRDHSAYLERVGSVCDGTTHCTIGYNGGGNNCNNCTNVRVSDPCPGLSKVLTAKYTCVRQASVKSWGECGGCPRGMYRQFKDGVKCTGTCPNECHPTQGGTCIDDTHSLDPKMPHWEVINGDGSGRRAAPSAGSHRYSCTSCPAGQLQTEPVQNTVIGNFQGCTGLNIADIASGKINWGATPDVSQQLKCGRDATISPKFEKKISKFPLLCSKGEYRTRLIQHPRFYEHPHVGGGTWYAAKCLMQKTVKCTYGDPMKCSVRKSALCLEVCKGKPYEVNFHEDMKRAFTRPDKECYPGCVDHRQKGGSIVASGFKGATGEGTKAHPDHVFPGESIDTKNWCKLPILGY